jgi:hypothetical protein
MNWPAIIGMFGGLIALYALLGGLVLRFTDAAKRAALLRELESSVRELLEGNFFRGFMRELADRLRYREVNWSDRKLRAPSLSQGLVKLAERRLPREMGAVEKQRWGQEMRADVASQPFRKRLLIAFNAWRKGASKIPVGAGSTARPAGD